MNLDLTPKEALWMSAALAVMAEVDINPAILPALSQPGRRGVLRLKEEGNWPSTDHTKVLMEKILARMQVECE